MKSRIKELAHDILDDLEVIRWEVDAKDRLPVEVMALNAVVNAGRLLEDERAAE